MSRLGWWFAWSNRVSSEAFGNNASGEACIGHVECGGPYDHSGGGACENDVSSGVAAIALWLYLSGCTLTAVARQVWLHSYESAA